MKKVFVLAFVLSMAGLVACGRQRASLQSLPASPVLKVFQATGAVRQILPDSQLVIQHEAISNFMPAMTMPFRLKNPAELAGLRAGDEISFRLSVTENESWIDQIVRIKNAGPAGDTSQAAPKPPNRRTVFNLDDMPRFTFTNELGRQVRLQDFKGQALAITFFFTRCPVPEYCPRLSRNFAGACQRLAARPDGPKNWQLVSISFDPTDTPAVLKSYAERYQYDPAHWSFLTGKAAEIRALTRGLGMPVTPDAGFFAHDFRTLIFDATGRLQTIWPFSGDFTGNLVDELIKAAAARVKNVESSAH